MKEDSVMKKIAALLLTIALLLSCVSGLAETYFGNTVYCEAGYENDVYNGVAKVLHLYEDGTFELRDTIKLGFTIDERIADGTYFAKSIRLMRHIFAHPELLDEPAANTIEF